MAMAHKPSLVQEPLEIVTLSDLTAQITTNALVLFPREKNVKVVTAQVPSGLIHYCSILADETPQNYPNAPHRPKVVLKGIGATNRRAAILALLDETERRVGKEILNIGMH